MQRNYILTYMLLFSPFQPQQPLISYTVEVVGPLSCTSDGIYLVGGALSGNGYLWDVCINTLKSYFLN